MPVNIRGNLIYELNVVYELVLYVLVKQAPGAIYSGVMSSARDFTIMDPYWHKCHGACHRARSVYIDICSRPVDQ